MKVITIKQPWATLIAKGYKEYEFRTWKTSYRGEILIHAAKTADKEAMKRFNYLHLHYPFGCLVAKANLTDCIPVDKKKKKEIYEIDATVYRDLITNNFDGYAFKLENVIEVDHKKVNGKLSLWEMK